MKALVNDTAQVDSPRDFQPGTLTLLCQDSADSVKVQKLCPLDQTALFVGRWEGMKFVIEKKGEPAACAFTVEDNVVLTTEQEISLVAAVGEKTRLEAMDVPTLRTEAATRGVKWDAKASPETMIQRIAAAAAKK